MSYYNINNAYVDNSEVVIRNDGPYNLGKIYGFTKIRPEQDTLFETDCFIAARCIVIHCELFIFSANIFLWNARVTSNTSW